jgi:conjugative relaxase-like TrwC/TraI family protein
MLGVHGIGRDKADYYLSDLARELPVSGPGHWVGTAAAGLGLVGPVEPEAFRRLLEGRHPGAGVPLGSGRTSVAAFDLTFSAPKSASVLFALGDAAATRCVLDAHAQAVAGSLSYLERHGITATRRSGAERVVLPASGALAAQFTHGVNRNGDPHVHTHVVLANLVHGADGRWSACDRRGIDAHRSAASAVYEAHLRAGLASGLGLHWTGPPGRTAEIEGVRPELLGEFSTRAADIRRHMYEAGTHSGRGARVAWAATRPGKVPSAPFADLAAVWQRRSLAIGGPRRLELGPVPARPGRARLDEHRFAGVLSVTPHGGARRRDVVHAFAVAARDGAPAAALDRLVDRWVPPGDVGVAEPLRQRRTVVPAHHLLRALGPRPVDPDEHEVWLGAARAIDAYRDRWGLGRDNEPVGTSGTPPSLASLPTTRLADHVRLEQQLQTARVRLGWRDPVAVELGLGR